MKKTIVLSQILSLIIEIFAMSFIIGGMSVGISPQVSALDTGTIAPVGCCISAEGGGICQEMNLGEAQACKSGLIPTNCNQIDECQVGCCYSKEEGICAYNSPKKKCQQNNGNWSASPLCQTPECALGCCILDDEASITTVRECTLKSRNIGLEKDFQPLDSDGTCNSKIRLKRTGACLFPSADYSGESDCRFLSKGMCQTKGGTFYEDFLCTAKDLNTTCFKAKNTTCVQGNDKMYYVDSCGNQANIYDASKYDDEDYWEKVIIPGKSCKASAGDGSCGNCDYTSGSICSKYRKGIDVNPTYGENVCRNLDCANGRKHGESWCLSDYDSSKIGVAAIGSRQFRGICMYGEVSIEPCADFNQEICQEGSSGSYTEARCIPNQWRSCLAANDYDNYEDIKTACQGYDQCFMFNETSNLSQFPGFMTGTGAIADPNTPDGNPGTITPDGTVDDIGKGDAKLNGKIPYCLPKYNPGMVFWTTGDTNNSYGGSYLETKAICSLGNYNCVTRWKQSGAAWQASYSWVNAVCRGDSPTSSAFAEALNERCRMLGPCGIQINTMSELGRISTNTSAFSQIYVDENGNQGNPAAATGFNLTEDYLEGLKTNSGITNVPGSLPSLTIALILALVTGRATDEGGSTQAQATTTASEAAGTAPSEPMGWYVALGALTAAGISGVSGVNSLAGVGGANQPSMGSIFTTTGPGGKWAGLGGWGATIGYALVAAGAGYLVGQMTAKFFGFGDNVEAQTFSEALALGFASGIIAAKGAYVITNLIRTTPTSNPWIGGVTFVVVAIIVSYLYYINSVEKVKYWVTHYECKPWLPPLTGDCTACNNDIRPCSEYRCKSIGQNCHYFNANGEPGWCAENDEIWSATIKPWKEALSSGLAYTDVGELKFKITTDKGGQVPAWTGVDFGVITSKQARCKIDTKHTDGFNSMTYDMVIDPIVGCEAGNCINQGIYHKISISPYVSDSGDTTSSTLKLNQGENEFYIRCQNFAGQTNRAEFVVKIIVGEGPDLTPPIITSFRPESGSYLKVGVNKTAITAFVNEPAECRYSQGANSRYEEMTKKLSCVTGDSAAVLGNWPCYGSISDLNVGENKIYIQCRDQPNLLEEQSTRRNINRNSKEYSINVCDKGLNITKISPTETMITGKSPISIDIEAETSGCINGGEAICSYKFAGGMNIPFLNTGKKYHAQNFTNMINGTHKITINCVDKAGNSDTKMINVTINLDDIAPSVIKTYSLSNQLVVQTDENSQCKFITNSSIGCAFSYDSNNATLMGGEQKYHAIKFQNNQNYYIKCSDIYGNVNPDCSIMVKTYNFNLEEEV